VAFRRSAGVEEYSIKSNASDYWRDSGVGPQGGRPCEI